MKVKDLKKKISLFLYLLFQTNLFLVEYLQTFLLSGFWHCLTYIKFYTERFYLYAQSPS
jgi:hypothetical protein